MQYNHPFRRVFDLDSAFNERASPRSKLFSDLYGMLDMNHSLFPQNRLHNFILDPESGGEHRSVANSLGSSSHRSASGARSAATSIPVVHLPSSSSSVHSSVHSDLASLASSSCTAPSTTSSAARVRGLPSSGNSSQTRRESEAEVDALTNILMKNMGGGAVGGKSYGPRENEGRIQQTTVLAPITQQPYSVKRMPSSSSRQQQQQQHTGSSASSTTSLSRQSSLSSFSECHRCRRSLDSTSPSSSLVSEPVCGPLNTRFHQACFCCYRCGSSLNTDSFFYAQKRLLCARCIHDSLEKCTVCDLVINDRIIRVLGQPYHPKCFTCVACHACLDGRAFTVDVHERMFCLDDFHRRYAPRCDGCGQPIRPPDSTTGTNSGGMPNQNKRIVAGRKTYHLECFGIRDKA